MKKLREQKAITLIALVITIIVLLILASVSIAMLTGENGILNQAKKVKDNTDQAAKNEMAGLNSIEDYINEYTGKENGYSKEKGVNAPRLVYGMREVMFKLPEGNNKGEVIEKGQQGFDENNWYNYEESKWANTRTEDGSYWVWIPRYAYKITYKNPSNKSEGGSIDVKFLVGTTDQYYDENGDLKTAKRLTSATEIVDTTKDYYVHPTFTDERKINFANGGWDKELTGIWVAKFEAGFASGNNSAPVKVSSTNYSCATTMLSKIEADSNSYKEAPARNWLDGIYGGTTTPIKYPTFQPKTYVMNYISINDAYNISKVLTENNNIYGLNSSNTDSHLIKNSEWGAIAYLGYSQFGSHGVEPYLNNISLNNSVESIYAVTGVTTGTNSDEEKITTIENINGTNGNTSNGEIYTWDQIEGQKASNTLNMYGIYDMNGGAWERTTGYIANSNDALKKYGASVAYEGDRLKTVSTKYTMVYPFDEVVDNTNKEETEENMVEASLANYEKNKNIYGDAIREMSTKSGEAPTAWNNDYSWFPGLHNPFIIQSSAFWDTTNAGITAFNKTYGIGYFHQGFRTVLIYK